MENKNKDEKATTVIKFQKYKIYYYDVIF